MKKIIRKFAVCLLLLLFIFTLSACGYTIGELLDMAKIEKNAELNAIAYVMDKYGFLPSVVSSECATYDSSPVPNFSPSPTGYAYVEMRDPQESDTFWVYATGEEINSQECWDNYQHAQIEEAVRSQMEALLGTEAAHIDLLYGRYVITADALAENSTFAREFALVHDYFDGTNFPEVLGNAIYQKMVVCITDAGYIPDLMGSPIGELTEDGAYEGTLSKNDAFVQVFGENIDCLIINYKDADALDAAHREGCAATVTRQPIPSSIGDSAVYIKDQYYITAGSHSEEIFTEYRKYE